MMRLGPAEVRFTGRREGDLRGDAGRARQDGGRSVAGVAQVTGLADEGDVGDVAARRRAVVDLPWTWLRQAHGAGVVVVEAPGARAGEEADGAVTAVAGAPLAVLTADCAPVVLASAEGVIAAAHAGWRGLVAGVVERTVDAMRALGATDVEAALGPCIHVECYEFGPRELDVVAGRLGAEVRGTTATGAPGLDVPAAVAAALRRAGAELVHDEDVCTACAADRFFSHRARGEAGRQATVVWR